MVVRRGWIDAKGRFYTRYVNRDESDKEYVVVNKRRVRNKEYVDKHTGKVYGTVENVGTAQNPHFIGVGYKGIEPKYANLSGGDDRVRYSSGTKYVPRKPRSFKVREIRVMNRPKVKFKKPVTIWS